MKLSKPSAVLINVALVLLIAILLKTFLAFPKNAAAAVNREYLVAQGSASTSECTAVLNDKTKEGWRFVSAVGLDSTPYFIFER